MLHSRRRFVTLSAPATAAATLWPWVGKGEPARNERGTWRSGSNMPWATQEIYCTTRNDQIVLEGTLLSS